MAFIKNYSYYKIIFLKWVVPGWWEIQDGGYLVLSTHIYVRGVMLASMLLPFAERITAHLNH